MGKYMLKNKKQTKLNTVVTNPTYYYTLLKVIGVGFLVSISLLFFLTVSGAWFTGQVVTQSALNIGNVVIATNEINNPYYYLGTNINLPSTVTNLSNTHVVIRAHFSVYWEAGHPVNDITPILASSNWTEGDDGFFYYNFVLSPSGTEPSTADFLLGLNILDETGERLGESFVVTIYYEAAQLANLGYANLWTTAPSEWLNLVG